MIMSDTYNKMLRPNIQMLLSSRWTPNSIKFPGVLGKMSQYNKRQRVLMELQAILAYVTRSMP